MGEYLGLFVLVALMGAGIPGPGDAALIGAGALAGQGSLTLGLVLLVAAVAWMSGSVLGYWFGSHNGRPLLDHPGRLESMRLRTLSKGDRMFGRHNFVASMVLPAFVSGIFHVKYRTFLAGAAVAGTLWVGGYVLLAYFVGPDFIDLFGDIGLRQVLGVAIIVGMAFAVRWLWHRWRTRDAELGPTVRTPSNQ